MRSLTPRQGAITIATTCHDMYPLPRDIVALQEGLTQLAKTYGIGK